MLIDLWATFRRDARATFLGICPHLLAHFMQLDYHRGRFRVEMSEGDFVLILSDF